MHTVSLIIISHSREIAWGRIYPFEILTKRKDRDPGGINLLQENHPPRQDCRLTKLPAPRYERIWTNDAVLSKR